MEQQLAKYGYNARSDQNTKIITKKTGDCLFQALLFAVLIFIVRYFAGVKNEVLPDPSPSGGFWSFVSPFLTFLTYTPLIAVALVFIYAIRTTIKESKWEIKLSPEIVTFNIGKVAGQWPVSEIAGFEHIIQQPETEKQQATHRLNLLHNSGKKAEMFTFTSSGEDPATDMHTVSQTLQDLTGKEVVTHTV